MRNDDTAMSEAYGIPAHVRAAIQIDRFWSVVSWEGLHVQMHLAKNDGLRGREPCISCLSPDPVVR